MKSGIPAIGWVGIGCGGLLLIALIAGILVFKAFKGKYDEFVANPEKAAAELVVSMNPELELISQDEAAGEMTIRTKDGEEVTLSYGDIAEGRITVKDKEGNVSTIGSADLSRVPEWVPLPPDFSDAVSSFQIESSTEIKGQVSGKTGLSAEEMEQFIETELSNLDGGSMKSSRNSSASAGDATVNTLEYKSGNRSLNAVITRKSGNDTLLNLNYSENK